MQLAINIRLLTLDELTEMETLWIIHIMQSIDAVQMLFPKNRGLYDFIKLMIDG